MVKNTIRGNKKAVYSYFQNGCQSQCVLLLLSICNCTCLVGGDHFLCHWLSTVQALTQSDRRTIFEWQKHNSANWKATDTYRHVTGTCRHVTEKHCCQYENSCNGSKVVVIQYLNSNSQMDRRGLVLDSKWEIFYTITFA